MTKRQKKMGLLLCVLLLTAVFTGVKAQTGGSEADGGLSGEAVSAENSPGGLKETEDSAPDSEKAPPDGSSVDLGEAETDVFDDGISAGGTLPPGDESCDPGSTEKDLTDGENIQTEGNSEADNATDNDGNTNVDGDQNAWNDGAVTGDGDSSERDDTAEEPEDSSENGFDDGWDNDWDDDWNEEWDDLQDQEIPGLWESENDDETERAGQQALYAVRDGVEVGMERADGQPFTEGTAVRIMSVEEMDSQNRLPDSWKAIVEDVKGEVFNDKNLQQPEEIRIGIEKVWEQSGTENIQGTAPYETALRSVWKDKLTEYYLAGHSRAWTLEEMELLQEQITESARRIEAYYVSVTDENGTELTDVQMKFRFNFLDTAWYEEMCTRSDSYHLARFCEEDGLTKVDELQISRNDTHRYVTADFYAETPGWYLLIQVDSDWKCPGVESEENSGTDEWDGEHGKAEDLSVEGGELGNGVLQDTVAGRQIQTAAAFGTLPSSGTPVTAAGSGFAQMPAQLPAGYASVKFYSGVSSLNLFTPQNGVVRGGGSGAIYLYPTTTAAKGTYGARYNKVLYYQNAWYDLKMTVVDFSDKTYAAGGKTAASFAPISFHATRIGWSFKQRYGELILKMEFLKHGTDTPAKVNTRFQWWDLDGAQRFGIRLGDGSFAAKYYYPGCTVKFLNNQKVAGDPAMYQILVSQGGALDSDDTAGNICFVLNNCSTYYMAFPYLDHAQDYADVLSGIASWNEKMAAGEQRNLDGLKQTDSDTPKQAPAVPQKTVAAAGSESWQQSNELERTDSAYRYCIEEFVPFEDTPHYYSKFVIEDALPQGVDYVGDAKIICMETGKDVTSWFDVAAQNDVVTAAAKAETLANASFYEMHYRMTFTVKMNTVEITPERQENTDTLVYTVKNRASVTAKHKTDGAENTEQSNEVVTTAKEYHAVIRLTKEIDTDRIVWAHGNPTFTFRVEGTDVYGQPHTYYDTVEFKKENTEAGERAAQTVEFRVPAGIYRASEEKTIRYRLASISGVSMGAAQGESVLFDVQKGGTAQAVFYNQKITDKGLSHTSFVRNRIAA